LQINRQLCTLYIGANKAIEAVSELHDLKKELGATSSFLLGLNHLKKLVNHRPQSLCSIGNKVSSAMNPTNLNKCKNIESRLKRRSSMKNKISDKSKSRSRKQRETPNNKIKKVCRLFIKVNRAVGSSYLSVRSYLDKLQRG